MPLSQFIRENTNDGTDIASVLIDVMNGRIDGSKVGHRLTAAKLLIIYGNDDADDFIADNILEASDTEWAERVRVSIDPVIASHIKLRSDGGRDICLFLIDVVMGRVEGINVGHRVAAAKHLLDRAYGRSPSRPLPKPPGSTKTRRTTHKTHQRVTPAQTETVATAPTASTAVLDEPEQGSESRTGGVEPIYLGDEPFYLESDLIMAYEGCEDPNFDPYRAIHDENYARTYDCPNPECEVHGNPSEWDFDPNDHHY